MIRAVSIISMAFLNPENIVQQAGIEEGMKVADFGCGSGYRTIPIARQVGNSGKVYAFDILKEMLEVVRGKARFEHLLNVEVIWADLETPRGSQLASGLMDRVIIANILFQTNNKEGVIQEAFRVLKPKGKACVIEWDITAPVTFPPREKRVDKTKTKELFTAAGFMWEKEFYAGDHHYGLIFKKP